MVRGGRGDLITLLPGALYGTPTKRPVTERPVTKRPVTGRPFPGRPVTGRPN
jgi:hypothetical protein